MEELKILPQSVYKFKCADYLVSKTLDNLKTENWCRYGQVFQTCKSLHKNQEYSDIHKWFHECLNTLKNHLKYQCDEFKITTSWANKTIKDTNHHVHSHQNSVISGVFYLNDSNSGTIFGTDNHWSVVPEKFNFRLNNRWIQDENRMMIFYETKCVPGDLILFPSTLKHCTNLHLSAIERYSISFNSFPCGKIGEHESLNEMEIYFK